MHKYLISVDIEGITGVVNGSFTSNDGENYRRAQSYMAHDVNAVVEGILAADKDAWILVKDSHMAATNLDLNQLHPKAHVMQGWGETMSMVHPLDKSFTGVFCVGYHAGGSNIHAVLAHTMSSSIRSIKINNKLYNETGIAALEAGIHNIPIAFISGDDHCIKEAKQQLGNRNFTGVQVKTSQGRDAAISMSLEQAAYALKKGAQTATENLLQNKYKPLKLKNPLRAELRVYNVGFRASLFAKMETALKFAGSYKFDDEKYALSFTSPNTQNLLEHIEMLLKLIFGIKSTL